jgi:hypothetical protein
MKKSYESIPKAKARKHLELFIKKIYPKRKLRKNLKVLSLLGHEDHELRNVWDPLGVPRENITNIEKDPEAFELSKKRYSDVQTHYGTIEDFLDKTDETFDVINYDTTSQFGLNERNALRFIAYKGLLGDKGVLVSWFVGHREGGYNKQWFRDRFEEDSSFIDERDTSFIKDRSDLISRMICSIMIDGRAFYNPHPFVKLEPFSSVYKESVKVLSREHGIEDGKFFWDPVKGNKIIKKVLKDLSKKTFPQMGDDGIYLLKEALFYQDIGSYFTTLQKRMKYVGDNGTPMLIDINYLKRDDFSDITHMIHGEDGEHEIFIPAISDNKTLRKRINYFMRCRGLCVGEYLDERMNLGSSMKPLITKEKAIEEFKNGSTVEEIKEKFRGTNGKPLAQWKAHFTMGTYDK